MLINDLIQKLQDTQSLYGNIDVAIYNKMDYWYYNRFSLIPVKTKPHWICKEDAHIRTKATGKRAETIIALKIDNL